MYIHLTWPQWSNSHIVACGVMDFGQHWFSLSYTPLVTNLKKYWYKHYYFHSSKCTSKCCLQNISLYIQAPMFWLYLIEDARAEPWVLFQYPVRHIIIRSHEVSKLWDMPFKWLYHFKIGQVPWQQYCRSSCQISKPLDNCKYKSHSFENVQDHMIRNHEMSPCQGSLIAAIMLSEMINISPRRDRVSLRALFCWFILSCVQYS